MGQIKRELNMLLFEVNETIQEIEKDITSLAYQKETLGSDYYGRAAELRSQLLQGYELKANLIKSLNHV